MIDLLALFGGGVAPSGSAPLEDRGQGAGRFETLVRGILSRATADLPVSPRDQALGLIDAAEAALDVADLSDAEIEHILAGLTAGLAALANRSPELTDQLFGQIAQGGDAAATGRQEGGLVAHSSSNLYQQTVPGGAVPEGALQRTLTATPAGMLSGNAHSAAGIEGQNAGGTAVTTTGLRPAGAAAEGAPQGLVAGTPNWAVIADAGLGGGTGPGIGLTRHVGGAIAAPDASVAPPPPLTSPPLALPVRIAAESIPDLRRLVADNASKAAAQAHAAASGNDAGKPSSQGLFALLTQVAQHLPPQGGRIETATLGPLSADHGGPAGPPLSASVPSASAGATPSIVTPPQPPVEPREILGQIRAQVSEQGRIRVALRPDGLGTVEIDLAPDEAGNLRVVVRADSAAVLNALRGERDGLAAMLRDAGHMVDDQALSFADYGSGRNRDGTGIAQGLATGDGAAEHDEKGVDIVLPLVAANGVDVTI